MAVYLLHSTVPIRLPSGREVRHYLGCTIDGRMGDRLREHQAGRHTARVVKGFLAVLGEIRLGQYWPGLGHDDERRMKRAGHLGDKCLICRAERLEREYQQMIEAAGLSLRRRNGRS